MEKFEYNLTIEELRKRTSSEYLITKKLLDVDSKEYLSLDDGDKKALIHLVRAAYMIGKIYLMTDNVHNIDIGKWLESEINNGSEYGKLTKILFDGQYGVNAVDNLSHTVELVKGIKTKDGKGFYPEDLTKEEFHNILLNMINNGKIDKVKNILTQRSMVVRDGDELKGIDYVEYFKDEFLYVANELIQASECSSNNDFNEYLKLQAEALKNPDPMLDAYADKKWATLQDTPLEFTITRENYEDEMTTTIIENEKLSKLLDDNNVKVVPKDSLGCRVGIVNKEGTQFLTKIKKYIPILAKDMPYSDEYTQNISFDDKQTMVDVDIVIVAGDVGAYRGGITLAENLPNDDKMTFEIGGGRRNVYHRQIRFIADEKKLQKRLDAILDKNQHEDYLEEADHWYTIGHENAHSLGIKIINDKLGRYSDIIEENKADMASLSFVDKLTELGMYNEKQKKQIIVMAVVENFLKSKPTFSQAHRVRNVMQNKYFYDHGAYQYTDDGKIHINIDKVVSIAKKMLKEILRVQIDNDFKKAEEFVNKYFVWTNEMQMIADKLQEVDKSLNGRVEAKLAEWLNK